MAHKLARAVYHMLRRGQAFEATKFFPGTTRGEQPGRPEIGPGARGDGHDASRSGPTRPLLEGGRYVDPPEITRRRSRGRVHERDRVTTEGAVGAAARVEEAR